jgi:hypothetical protein
MIARVLQRFSFALLFCALSLAAARELAPGDVSPITFRDVDGNDLSTADGHVTILTVVTREHETEAQAVADQVPDEYLGNPKYRYITLVNFQGKLVGPIRSLTRVIIRNRLDGEAKKLRPEYAAKQIQRDPRKDVFVIADFDGAAVAKLGLTPANAQLLVFVFNGQGKLVKRFDQVPPGDALAHAIKLAEH